MSDDTYHLSSRRLPISHPHNRSKQRPHNLDWCQKGWHITVNQEGVFRIVRPFMEATTRSSQYCGLHLSLTHTLPWCQMMGSLPKALWYTLRKSAVRWAKKNSACQSRIWSHLGNQVTWRAGSNTLNCVYSKNNVSCWNWESNLSSVWGVEEGPKSDQSNQYSLRYRWENQVHPQSSHDWW